jgi:hypothetical protein
MRDPLQLGSSVRDGLGLLGSPEMLDEVESRRQYRGRDAGDSGAKGMIGFRREHRPGRRGETLFNPVL